MHLFFENIIRILVNLWSGKFKNLDVGTEDYEIPANMWDEIWRETAEGMRDIPADFIRSMGSGPGSLTAEAWCFWFTYLAPILLKGRFNHPKYHQHLCDFSDIIKTCINFTLTHAQIETLRDHIITWVETYERFYYQYAEERLSACPLRYCGFLKGALSSKTSPWANLNNIVLHRAYLEQLEALYDLTDELASPNQRTNGLSSSEFQYEHYPQTVLRLPCQKTYAPDVSLRRKIGVYFAALLGKTIREIEPQLPEVMARWGKVRIVDGDSIASAWVLARRNEAARNTSVIRVSVHWIPQTCYGRLDEIVVCKIPPDQVRLLAVITPYKTGGKDAALGIVFHSQPLIQIVADIQSIMAVVGRIQSQGKWYIVDRTGGMVRPEFIPGDEGDEEDE
ncbi:hypothetical protein DFH07DRAFT_867316 [Mycena maculata]|uniref:Uncharacterized protein n=1 Tax=Mycena maculata TaxID=230809 RepID=A0AAD7NJW3_9AGAR|nr:hypothetical protein DFH07DRAFT_867316 [Mycena maculata]